MVVSKIVYFSLFSPPLTWSPFDGNIFHMSWNHLGQYPPHPPPKTKKTATEPRFEEDDRFSALVGGWVEDWRMKISDNTLKMTCNTKMQVWNMIFLFSNGGLWGSMLIVFFFFGGGGNWKLFWLIHWQLKAKMEKNTGNWHAENLFLLNVDFWMITVLSMIHFVNLILSRIQVHKKGIHCFWMFYSRMINATFILDCQCL